VDSGSQLPQGPAAPSCGRRSDPGPAHASGGQQIRLSRQTTKVSEPGALGRFSPRGTEQEAAELQTGDREYGLGTRATSGSTTQCPQVGHRRRSSQGSGVAAPWGDGTPPAGQSMPFRAPTRSPTQTWAGRFLAEGGGAPPPGCTERGQAVGDGFPWAPGIPAAPGRKNWPAGPQPHQPPRPGGGNGDRPRGALGAAVAGAVKFPSKKKNPAGGHPLGGGLGGGL